MKENPNYFAIITSDVRYDKNIPANAKLLFGEITALCNATGVCWARNSYFAELYGVSNVTISRWVKALVDGGYITSELKYREGTKEIEARYIRLCGEGIIKNVNRGINKNVKENSTSINNTSNNKDNASPYKEIFNHYITLPHLVTHKKYTESMKKAIAKAMKECGLTMDECKELLDRHNEVVRMTKDEGKYKVEKRGLQDFFGQKAYQSQKLICEEYMEGGVKYEKYLANKTQPQDNERQRELDKERSELMF